MAALKEYWDPFFDLLGAPLRRKIALVLYANTYICEADLPGSKKPGITVKDMSKAMNAPEKTVRYHMKKLVEGGLAEKYAGIHDKRAVGLYKASERFSKTLESLSVDKSIENYIFWHSI